MSDRPQMMRVPFGDLKREVDDCGPEVREAIERVLASGWFVLGREVEAFESEFAAWLGSGVEAVGVASGTEAVQIALMALGVGSGDYVVTVPNTAMPTVSAITAAGATPLLVDVCEDSFNMDPRALEELLERERPRLGDRVKAIVVVHLYGQCADMDAIMSVAGKYGLSAVEDAAQAHGATYRGRMAGTLGDVGAFSFYPSKNLGCYGDGGAVVTRRPEIADRVRLLRNYGQRARYLHETKGLNSRLDELQAAILRAKLPHLNDWLARRREIAMMYSHRVHDPAVVLPRVVPGCEHAWHLYAVRHADRDWAMQQLADAGVGTIAHYPVPIHLQAAYADLGLGEGAFPVAERAAAQVFSLPLFPQLRDDEIDYVCDVVNSL